MRSAWLGNRDWRLRRRMWALLVGLPRTVVVACVIALCLGTSFAAAQVVGPEFRADIKASGPQIEPAVAAAATGSFVVVWRGVQNDEAGVFGRRFSSAAAPLGAPFPLSSEPFGATARPVVGTDEAGSFVAAWQRMDPPPALARIVARRFDAAGDPQGDEFSVVPPAMYLWDPQLAVSTSGNFLVVWGQAETLADADVYGRVFDASGSPVGGAFRVNSYTPGHQQFAAAASLGENGFVVVWDALADGSAYGIVAQRLDAVGAPVGNDFVVNAYTTGGQGNPAVAGDGQGGFVVAWQGAGPGSSYGEIYAQRFDADAQRVGPEFQVNSLTLDAQMRPAVAASGSGEFIVSWSGYVYDGSEQGIFARQFSASGDPAGQDFQVNVTTAGMQLYPAVAMDRFGSAVVVWESEEQFGSSVGVYGRRTAFVLFADGFESGDVCSWSGSVGGTCD